MKVVTGATRNSTITCETVRCGPVRSQVQADASRRLGLRWMRGKTHVRGVYNVRHLRLGQSAGEREREDFLHCSAAKASGREMLGAVTKKGVTPHNLGGWDPWGDFISTESHH